MNKRIKKKKEIMNKLICNTEYSLCCMKFDNERERKIWIKYMTYKV